MGIREVVESEMEEWKQKREGGVRESQGEVGAGQELDVNVLTKDMLDDKREPKDERPCNPYEEHRI